MCLKLHASDLSQNSCTRLLHLFLIKSSISAFHPLTYHRSKIDNAPLPTASRWSSPTNVKVFKK